jgi:hypothetical protein
VPLKSGTSDKYLWLTSDEHQLADLLKLRPNIVQGKYVAITSIDSGFLALTPELKSSGWESRLNVAYSPSIQSWEELPLDGYDEWYVSDKPMDLGDLCVRNPFETPVQPGHLQVFINYGGFNLWDPVYDSLVEMFWKQLGWISPESYLADGSDYLLFVSRNQQIFQEAIEALRVSIASPPDSPLNA